MIGYKGFKKAAVISAFILPGFIGMLVFVIVPILISLGLSFTNWDLIGAIKFTGLRNYILLFKDEYFMSALRNTLIYIVITLPAVVVISLGLALLMNEKLKGIVLFRAIYFLPVVSSWVAVSMIWKWLFNPAYGLINYFLSFIGIHGIMWLNDSKWALYAIIITSVWKDIGFAMVIFLTGLQEIPDSYYEASKLDGANGLQRLWHITIPLLSPTTFFITTILLINYFQIFDQVMIMTEGGPAGSTMVIVERIYKNAFSYYKMGYASAISWALFAIIFAVTVIQNKLQKRYAE